MRSIWFRRWAAEWADITGWWVAWGSAFFLLLAMFMPNWWARTSWTSGDRNRSSAMVDSPASYAGQLSLCGLIAFVALAVCPWKRRLAAQAALAAAVPFAVASYVAASSWLDFSRGTVLLDGRPTTDLGSRWTVHMAPLLPLFVLAAIAGTICTLALAVYWRGDPRTRP